MASRGIRLQVGSLFRVLVGVSLAAVVGMPGTAHAAADPRIDSVSLARASVSARGFALARVTLTVRVSNWPADEEPASATLIPVGRTLQGGADELDAALHRVSGVPGTGTYQGTVFVPSSARGRWRVDAILAAAHDIRDLRDDHVPDVTLTVHGTHPPVLRISIPEASRVGGRGSIMPYPRATFTTVATLIDADTGRPLAHRKVWISSDFNCATTGHARKPTDRRGRVTVRVVDQPYLVCAMLPLPVTAAHGWGPLTPDYAYAWENVWYGVRLQVHRPPAVTTKGTRVRVTGSVLAVRRPNQNWARAWGEEIDLQQAVGRRWHTVDTEEVSQRGRYHLTTPPARGRAVYRVWFPWAGDLAGAASHSFAVTARS